MLVPFLLLLVVEGFNDLMRNVVVGKLFYGFRVGQVVISYLQYANDTLCICEAPIDNIWTLKAIFQGFELVFGLTVNIWKSCLVGVNVTMWFMQIACMFQNIRDESVPFEYVVLSRVNPWSLCTRELGLEQLHQTLGLWAINTLTSRVR